MADTILKIAQRIDGLSSSAELAMGAGLRIIGEAIMTDVKASSPGRGVPRDTGALAASGRVRGPTDEGGRPAVTLSFGGASAPYALEQHENMMYRHTVGEARYLVRGLERFQDQGFEASAEALRIQMAFALKRASRKAG